MLRADRPRLASEPPRTEPAQVSARDVLLAIAPPPSGHSFALNGWPNWLIPAYRSGGHKPEIRLLEEDP